MRNPIARALALSLWTTVVAASAHAGQIGRDADLRRTGWYSDQDGLWPATVSSGAFGPLFTTAVTGQVYAQPLVFNGTLLIATQSNWIYGLDPLTGAIRWSRNVGTPVNASDVPGCTDITPVIGITATPVINDSTGIAYFTAKAYRTGSSGPVQWKLHAIAVATGAEQTGFPVTLSGTADNNHDQTFTPATQTQRTGLLLLNGVVYFGFSSVCDVSPWQGWVMGVSTAGVITARWVDRSGNNTSGGGIWMAGSALVSDGPGQILLASGNGIGGGTPNSPIPGTSPPADLGESVIRLAVQANGTLMATDFFTPYNSVADYEPIDADLGSGGVVGLPAHFFGTPTDTNLFVQIGKPGNLYLLDGSALGGCQEGPGGTDAVIGEFGFYGGVWSKPAVWGGDGGWLYVPSSNTSLAPDATYGYLRALHAAVDSTGKPIFTLAGSSSDPFGFSSSAPVVTSYGANSGSALVWIVWNPDASGFGAQLRAYDPVPVDGTLQLRYSAPVGRGSKFNPPGVFANRLYVGTRDGHVLGFGLTNGGVSVPDDPAVLTGARLGAASPNPFSSSTSMQMVLAKGGRASLTIYDASGRRVRQLFDGDAAAGSQRIVWDGRNDAGANVPAGLYLARMDVAGARQTRRVLVVR